VTVSQSVRPHRVGREEEPGVLHAARGQHHRVRFDAPPAPARACDLDRADSICSGVGLQPQGLRVQHDVDIRCGIETLPV
jgi:hypothetical protein